MSGFVSVENSEVVTEDIEALRENVETLGAIDKQDGLFFASVDYAECIDFIDRAIARDDKTLQRRHLFLGKWGFVNSHIIPVILAYRDKKQYIYPMIKIATRLTMPLDVGVDQYAERIHQQRQMKRAFSNVDAIRAIMTLMVSPLSLWCEGGFNDQTMDELELYLVLFRNLLCIPDDHNANDSTRFLHDQFILALRKADFTELLTVVTQYSVKTENARIALLMLELWHHFFSLELAEDLAGVRHILSCQSSSSQPYNALKRSTSGVVVNAAAPDGAVSSGTTSSSSNSGSSISGASAPRPTIRKPLTSSEKLALLYAKQDRAKSGKKLTDSSGNALSRTSSTNGVTQMLSQQLGAALQTTKSASAGPSRHSRFGTKNVVKSVLPGGGDRIVLGDTDSLEARDVTLAAKIGKTYAIERNFRTYFTEEVRDGIYKTMKSLLQAQPLTDEEEMPKPEEPVAPELIVPEIPEELKSMMEKLSQEDINSVERELNNVYNDEDGSSDASVQIVDDNAAADTSSSSSSFAEDELRKARMDAYKRLKKDYDNLVAKARKDHEKAVNDARIEYGVRMRAYEVWVEGKDFRKRERAHLAAQNNLLNPFLNFTRKCVYQVLEDADAADGFNDALNWCFLASLAAEVTRVQWESKKQVADKAYAEEKRHWLQQLEDLRREDPSLANVDIDLLAMHVKAPPKPKYRGQAFDGSPVMDALGTESLEFACNFMLKSSERPVHVPLLVQSTRVFHECVRASHIMQYYGNSYNRNVAEALRMHMKEEKQFILLASKMLKSYEATKMDRNHLGNIVVTTHYLLRMLEDAAKDNGGYVEQLGNVRNVKVKRKVKKQTKNDDDEEEERETAKQDTMEDGENATSKEEDELATTYASKVDKYEEIVRRERALAKVEFSKFVNYFTAPQVICNCFHLISQYKTLPSTVLDATVRLLSRIAFDQGYIGLFYQLSVLVQLNEVLQDTHIMKSSVIALREFAYRVSKQYFISVEKNPLIFMETLFWTAPEQSLFIADPLTYVKENIVRFCSVFHLYRVDMCLYSLFLHVMCFRSVVILMMSCFLSCLCPASRCPASPEHALCSSIIIPPTLGCRLY